MADERQRRQYPAEFQLEAVRLADSVGLNAAAHRLGVPRATIGNWARRRRKVAYAPQEGRQAADAGAVPKRSAAELEVENARLRRELASQKLDNEILRKAALDSTGQRNGSDRTWRKEVDDGAAWQAGVVGTAKARALAALERRPVAQ